MFGWETVSRKAVLPVDTIVPEIVSSLSRHPNLVIEAPPGAGKTTRVPPALFGFSHRIPEGEVVVVEPRRIAARLAARRVAWEMGEQLGGTVGYQVRFEEVVGPGTRLRFVTEGVLTRRLLSDPFLKDVSVVVLDEFHERHLEGDLALALLKRLQCTRTDLRIVVMSATLDSDPIVRFLDDCPKVRSEGKLFELSIQHFPYSSAPLETRVKDAVESLIAAKHSGDILTFLPGAAEIRRAMRGCEAVGRRAGLAGDTTKADSGYERRRKLGDNRGRNRRHRQWTGALRGLFSLERAADALHPPSEQGLSHSESRPRGPNITGSCAASLHRRRFPATPGTRDSGDSAQ